MPLTALAMTLFMLSLTGIPPLAGFWGKFYLFTAIVDAHLTWLAVVAVLMSAVSAFYYLRVVWYLFFREAEGEAPELQAVGRRRLGLAGGGRARRARGRASTRRRSSRRRRAPCDCWSGPRPTGSCRPAPRALRRADSIEPVRATAPPSPARA